MYAAHVAVVTGAGSGIGRATAVALAERGWGVVLAGRRREVLEETGRTLRGEWAAVPTDVADPAACAALVAAAVGRFGRIDALVNNAAEAPLMPIEKTDPATLRRVYAVNALGPAYLIAAAWPHLARGGCVVNVSTIGTTGPFPGFFAYASSKGAVEVMARSCAGEGRERGIRAFAVAPGAVETAMLRAHFPEGALPRSRCLRPEDVADVIVDCILGRRDAENGGTILVPSP